MAKKIKKIKLTFTTHGGYGGEFVCRDYDSWQCPKLCEGSTRRYVELDGAHTFEMTLTNKRPRGDNFHILGKYMGEWRLKGITEHSPGFYSGFTGMLDEQFCNGPVYAWVMA